MPGKFHERLAGEYEASSLFDAADKFIDYWCTTSGWDSEAIITVKCNGKEYRVRQWEKLWDWRRQKHGYPR